MDLDRLARSAAIDVAELIEGSRVKNDGAGAYILMRVESSKPESIILASVPTLYEGQHAKWALWDNDHNTPVESLEYDAFSNPRDVADAIRTYIDVWIERTNEKFGVSETV